MSVRDRIVELRRVPAAELRANPRNWRRHPPAQAEAVRSVLEQVGYAGAVLARETPEGLELIDGHLRKEVSPGETVPVLVLDVDEDEAALILATLDPLGAMAETDGLALYELLQQVEIADAGLADVLAALATAPEAPIFADPDELPELPPDPVTRPGDRWILGTHVLLCGDSTAGAIGEVLDGGGQADGVFTDPPYNVDYRGGTAEHLTIENDAQTAAHFAAFLAASFAAMHAGLRPGAPVYVCHPDTTAGLFRSMFVDAGFLLKQCLVWVKNSFVLSRQDYNWQHESILYGWKAGAAHPWYGPFNPSTVIDDERELQGMRKAELLAMLLAARDASTVIREDRPARSADHPTMKPVALVTRLLANSLRAGDTLLDPFAGSGSTLIAAEMLGMRCRAVELDPAYCDVIVSRWEAFTGKNATREHDAEPLQVHG